MNRPDPIEYADRLYDAIRAANFSPISFLAFGNAVKDGVSLRNLPRVAAEPFMRIVGEMLDLEEEVAAEQEIFDGETVSVGHEAHQPTLNTEPAVAPSVPMASAAEPSSAALEPVGASPEEAPSQSREPESMAPATGVERRRNSKR